MSPGACPRASKARVTVTDNPGSAMQDGCVFARRTLSAGEDPARGSRDAPTAADPRDHLRAADRRRPHRAAMAGGGRWLRPPRGGGPRRPLPEVGAPDTGTSRCWVRQSERNEDRRHPDPERCLDHPCRRLTLGTAAQTITIESSWRRAQIELSPHPAGRDPERSSPLAEVIEGLSPSWLHQISDKPLEPCCLNLRAGRSGSRDAVLH